MYKPKSSSPSWSAVSSDEGTSSDGSSRPTDTQSHGDTNLRIIEQPGSEVDDLFTEEKQVLDSIVIHAREYQLEMLEESLKRNIIVAMETGTGKTQVAVLRIQAQLEKSSPEKLIWFLAPTVALCEQQARVLKQQIPAVQAKFLTGSDGVDTWTDIRTWDDYLKNVHIVVSTYQVLLDAISHAFVPIGRLSLLVLDEAHNCVGKHPGSKIMDLYRAQKIAGLPIPSVLGLTASPIMKSKPDALELIEQTLDAVCRSPTIHREELLSTVKKPSMYYIYYSQPDCAPLTSTMETLGEVHHDLNRNIYADPYVVKLQADNSERSRLALRKALQKRDTYVLNQIYSLWRKSNEIHRELGPWAADYFIYISVTRFLMSVKRNDSWYQEWQVQEKKYLAGALEKVQFPSPPPFEDDTLTIDLSEKVRRVVNELSCSADGTKGIIFVREIATVATLAHILSVHPSLKNRFKIGTMVGANSYVSRKRDLGAVTKAVGDQDLEEFRKANLNLLVATSVLEEGIDVPACNMVVCFDKPDNLKAFIQRRGRARMRESKLILMMDRDKSTAEIDEWTELENEMKKRYEDDMREIQELIEIEESERPDIAPLCIPETGAHLDFDQAKSHLEHFCRRLSVRQYVDSRPYYIFRRDPAALRDFPKIAATVVLPMSLKPELRRIESSGCWYSEKNASKDAAFQAYKAIYEAGYLNDNLLPVNEELVRNTETRASEVEVHERFNPWIKVAHAWKHQTQVYQRRLRLKEQDGSVNCEFDVTLPVPFPKLPVFNIFWNASVSWKVELGEMKVVSAQDLPADQSPALIDLAHRHRFMEVKDCANVLHIRSPNQDIPFQELVGQKSIEGAPPDGTVLIRNNSGYPYFFKGWSSSQDPNIPTGVTLEDEPVDTLWLALGKWARRKNFLHPIDTTEHELQVQRKPGITAWPARLCRMDGIDASSVCFGALIPSITHVVEINLVATELCNTLLKDVGYTDISLVTTAICSPGAAEATNYERIEFLGDTILKMFTTATITANNPHYPEGFLDAIKTNIVSNARLSRAAVEAGLDKFIIKRGFGGHKWHPFYVEDLAKAEEDTESKRKMSTKTLADVVEALIGAAYLDGGLSKALACIRIFIPDVKWNSLETSRDSLFSQTPLNTDSLATLAPLEQLIGYSFRNKRLLIEAATHSSFGLVNASGSCMERLEFLGDAVLDSIVVSNLWPHNLDQRQMHLFRTVCVNADLLGFLGMEWAIPQEITHIANDKAKTPIETLAQIPFWKFMRHVSAEMGQAQRRAEERHAAERQLILDAIHHGTEYPWQQLAHLHIPKFFSDFFESVLGAVWVDSGSTEACAVIIERIGILPYLRRMLKDKVEILHPKNRLGELAGKHLMTVEYQNEVRESDDETRELFCRILVAGNVMAEVGGGVSPEEIQSKAAYAAYKQLVTVLAGADEGDVDEKMGDVDVDVDVDAEVETAVAERLMNDL
ncbi:hypothetical protein M426DRAFT_319858 [Hypoxylon sp. CI-4A]|nr:hypothetical protein M426DRAFT_319858 [Hypoxylon sp. CI-4A]